MSVMKSSHFEPHGGTVYSHESKEYYRDFGGLYADGNAITIDHVIDSEANVRCEINATPLEEL